jgi:hypothetical protein
VQALEGRQIGDAPAQRASSSDATEPLPDGVAAVTPELPVLRRAARALVTHARFEPVVCFCIGLNALLVALEHAGQGPSGDSLQVCLTNVCFCASCVLTMPCALQHDVKVAFVVLFMLELAVQMVAHGPVAFLRSRWNCADGGVTISAALVLISGHRAFNINILRMLRLECVALQPVVSCACADVWTSAGAWCACSRRRADCGCW